VDREYLSKYERILHSKDGLAMVNVEHDSCGGCNINLPPQVINEIRMKEELIFCQSCARILYIEEEGQDVSQ
jgi:predicted  nucleic acid-binding Zn-ribbon protein